MLSELRLKANNGCSSRYFLWAMLSHNVYLLLQASQLRVHALNKKKIEKKV